MYLTDGEGRSRRSRRAMHRSDEESQNLSIPEYHSCASSTSFLDGNGEIRGISLPRLPSRLESDSDGGWLDGHVDVAVDTSFIVH